MKKKIKKKREERSLVALPATNLSDESLLDGGNRSPRVAALAVEEIDPVLLGERGLWAPAALADDVLGDVVADDGLDLLGLEAATDGEAALGIEGAGDSQLCQDVVLEVVVGAGDGVGGVGKVDPHRAAGAFAHDVGRGHTHALVAGAVQHVRVLVLEGGEDAVDQLLVGVVAVRAVEIRKEPRRALSHGAVGSGIRAGDDILAEAHLGAGSSGSRFLTTFERGRKGGPLLLLLL